MERNTEMLRVLIVIVAAGMLLLGGCGVDPKLAELERDKANAEANAKSLQVALDTANAGLTKLQQENAALKNQLAEARPVAAKKTAPPANQMPTGPFCQSCSMPMQKPDDFGTGADGFKQNDYCVYCFKNGAFTEPDITRDQMIDKVAKLMVEKTNMPADQAKAIAKMFIPKLKRWREK